MEWLLRPQSWVVREEQRGVTRDCETCKMVPRGKHPIDDWINFWAVEKSVRQGLEDSCVDAGRGLTASCRPVDCHSRLRGRRMGRRWVWDRRSLGTVRVFAIPDSRREGTATKDAM
jgi:hypothetical protein